MGIFYDAALKAIKKYDIAKEDSDRILEIIKLVEESEEGKQQ